MEYGYKFLEQPRMDYIKLEAMIDEYETRKSAMYGQAVRYDADGLGVRIQTSPANHFENNMCNILNLERNIDIAKLNLFCEWMTIKNIINQCDIKDRRNRQYVVDNIRKILNEYYNPFRPAPTLEDISKHMGLSYKSTYNNFHKGRNALALALNRHCSHEL